jgi:hypothetical protein
MNPPPFCEDGNYTLICISSAGVRNVLAYLRGLSTGRLVLWCYCIWYVVVLVRYFDPSPRLWLTSLGLSAIIGVALYISTTAGKNNVKLDFWQTFRLFLMPFCVSSFAALVKGRGFILIFSPKWEEIAIAVVLCAALCGTVLLLKRKAGAEAQREVAAQRFS